MNDLLVLKALGDDSARSPEFQYLLSLCLLHARQVFGHAQLATGEIPEGRFDAVLLLSDANVLLTQRSLKAMRDRLLAGAAEVRPYRLADTGLAGRFPVYTLRGYERLERAFLEEGPGSISEPPSPPAVTLLRWDEYQRRTGTPVYAGLYHEFIDYYGEVRADILPFVPPHAREVLEVGCGRGVTGRLLQERLGCRVTGVELNPVVAQEAARHLHRVLQGDVQTLDLEGRYDAVIALELVEHLVDSESFLARVRELLAPGGRAIFSIPNVGHWSIVEDLLAGRWDYLPIGLLCYTHYRFFTRRSLSDWLRRSGIERFDLIPQRTELPDRFRELPGGFEVDVESLSTKGFYVVVHA
ncbi:MAG TPA: class I SAM-dependent methyltransferase [Thermoanaerobaculia bacterium]|nr:class I SAM-dependent methyltransferase [Thermoanaerobaculia bacterium]